MIIPAIIPKSADDLRVKLDAFGFAEWLQIDVVDGKFDNDISWPYEPSSHVADLTPYLEGRHLEIDLMVVAPAEAAASWYRAGARRFVFHFGSLTLAEFEHLQTRFDAECGIALAADDSPEEAHQFIMRADFVQLMGIKDIGAQGQPFDVSTIERAAALRHLYPSKTISIDGGIDESNVGALRQAGVDRFVVGSAIGRAKDPQRKYLELLKIASDSPSGTL